MHTFNRVVVVVVALAVAAAAAVTILIAAGVVLPQDLPEGWFEPQVSDLSDASGGVQAAVIAVSVIIVLAVLVFVSSELRFLGREVRFLVSSAEEGATTVTRSSVRSLVEHIGRSMHNINHIECAVGEKEGKLAIACWVTVAIDANVPELSSRLRADIKRLTEELTGLPVSHVDVNTRYERGRSQHLAVR